MVAENERAEARRRAEAEAAHENAQREAAAAQREAAAATDRERLVREAAAAASKSARAALEEQHRTHVAELRALRSDLATVTSAVTSTNRRRRPPGNTPPRDAVIHPRESNGANPDGRQLFQRPAAHNDHHSNDVTSEHQRQLESLRMERVQFQAEQARMQQQFQEHERNLRAVLAESAREHAQRDAADAAARERQRDAANAAERER
eukprot:SAG11_NODE_2085_length_3847_cov_2.866329_2_plen_207_part_00